MPITRDVAKVLMEWEQASFRAAVPYLTGRGLGPALLTLPRFSGSLRVDRRGNVLFPHYDKTGLCGYEIKNAGFTGFAPGGTKGLWFSQCHPTDTRLVLAESAIDGMSYHVLNPEAAARYMSTGGSLSPKQPALLRGAMEKMAPGSVVILAFDDDEGGEQLTEEVRGLAPSSVELRRAVPPDGANDWNDALKAAKGLG